MSFIGVTRSSSDSREANDVELHDLQYVLSAMQTKGTRDLPHVACSLSDVRRHDVREDLGKLHALIDGK